MAIIKAPDVPAPTAVLCWTPAPNMVRCDRKAGHAGPHSWEHAESAPSLDTKDETKEETKNDQSRGGTSEMREGFQSSASQPEALAPPEPRWQPIETAPKEEAEEILVWDGFDVRVSWHVNGAWHTDAICAEPPTHWQPLPAPPRPEALDRETTP